MIALSRAEMDLHVLYSTQARHFLHPDGRKSNHEGGFYFNLLQGTANPYPSTQLRFVIHSKAGLLVQSLRGFEDTRCMSVGGDFLQLSLQERKRRWSHEWAILAPMLDGLPFRVRCQVTAVFAPDFPKP